MLQNSAIQIITAAAQTPEESSKDLIPALESLLLTQSTHAPIDAVIQILLHSDNPDVQSLTCKLLSKALPGLGFKAIYDTFLELLLLGLNSDSSSVVALIISLLEPAFFNKDNLELLVTSPVVQPLLKCIGCNDSSIYQAASECFFKVFQTYLDVHSAGELAETYADTCCRVGGVVWIGRCGQIQSILPTS
jgi:hypothetical protein